MKANTNKPKTGLTMLCGLLTFLLTVLLLVSVSVRLHVTRNEPAKAASAVQLDKVYVKNEAGTTVSLAKLIAEDYIQDSSVAEENMQTVLREGSFRYILGDKVNVWNTWLLSGDGELPEITEEECIAALKQNYALFYRETGFQLNAEGEATLRSSLQERLPALNKQLRSRLDNPLTHGMADGWLGVLAGVLLAASLVWMIVIQVSGGNSAGSAFIRCSTVAFVPSLLLLLGGAAGKAVLSETAYPDAVSQLKETWLTVGCIAVLGCAVLFGFGMIWKQLSGNRSAKAAPAPQSAPAEKPAPKEKSAPAEEAPKAPEEEPAPARRYCRFCGKPLVNNDAKFCYKCGKKQE